MIKLDRILLPTDFSENSVEAVNYGRAFAEQFHAELHLLHVIAELAATIPEALVRLASSIENYMDEAETRALKQLGEVLEADWCPGKRVVLATRQGSPFLQIVQYAREHAIDLIVMGTHGRSGLSHALIGSVAERVVRHAHCPVLSVRPMGHQFVVP
jgi:nucleotide-binding universal stress UspA family protein